ncbi:hypothetical protein ACFE04_021617 [Oxalis oulophora]
MVWRVLKKSHRFVPNVAYMSTRAKNVLDFNSLFENARKEYAYSKEMVSRVEKVCNIFSAFMKTQFSNIEIQKPGLPPKSSGPIFGRVTEEIGTPGPTSSSADIWF